MHNNTLSYTSSTLLKAYKKRRDELLPLLKEKKNEDELKKIHLALLSIDLCIQIFNDANRDFPVINKEITAQDNQSISLIKNKTSGITKLKKGLEAFGIRDADTYVDSIKQRTSSRQTGAVWQLKHFEKHNSIEKLMEDYMQNAEKNIPVHAWEL